MIGTTPKPGTVPLRVLMLQPADAEGSIACAARVFAEGAAQGAFDVLAVESTMAPETSTGWWRRGHWAVKHWVALARTVRRHRPDVVDIQVTSSANVRRASIDAMICRWFGGRVVLHWHTNIWPVRPSDAVCAPAHECRRLVAAADRIIVPTVALRTELLAAFPSVRPTVVRPPFVRPPGQFLEARVEDKVARRGIVWISYFGNHALADHALVAYACLPQSVQLCHTLTLVGIDAWQRRERLRLLARRLGTAQPICFAGHDAGDDVAAHLRSAAVLLVANDEGGLPPLVFEAMKLHVPLIAARTGAATELLADGHEALLVPPGDTLALTRTLARLLRDGRLGTRLAAAARLRLDRDYSADRASAAIAAVWRDAARQPMRPAGSLVPRLAISPLRAIL